LGVLDSCRIQCPYCGESVDLTVDIDHEAMQYVEDCHVCCRPISVCINIDAQGGPPTVTVKRDDE